MQSNQSASPYSSDGHNRRRPNGGNAAHKTLSNWATTAAVAYGAYQLGSWAWNQYQETETRSNNNSNNNNNQQNGWKRRKSQWQKSQKDVRRTVERFMKTVKRTLDEQLPTQPLTQELKQLRQAAAAQHQQQEQGTEQALWERLSVQFLIRLFVAVYSYTLLSLVLTVQVHFLAQHAESQHDSSSSSASTIQLLQETYSYFFDTGIFSLIRSVERAVLEVTDCDGIPHNSDTATWSQSDLSQTMARIRQQMEGTNAPNEQQNRRRQRRRRTMLRFIMSPQAHGTEETGERTPVLWMEELWDLLESPVARDAEYDALGYVWNRLSQDYWYQGLPLGDSSQSASKPMALVIPQFKHAANSLFQSYFMSDADDEETFETSSEQQNHNNSHDNDETSMISQLQKLPTLLELAESTCYEHS